MLTRYRDSWGCYPWRTPCALDGFVTMPPTRRALFFRDADFLVTWSAWSLCSMDVLSSADDGMTHKLLRLAVAASWYFITKHSPACVFALREELFGFRAILWRSTCPLAFMARRIIFAKPSRAFASVTACFAYQRRLWNSSKCTDREGWVDCLPSTAAILLWRALH